MAFSSHRTRFKGDLVGIEQDRINELDYSKEKLEDRLEYVKEKYENVSKYHEEYTSDYYKVDVNVGDNLSSDINIFKALEKDANYILNSVDVSKERQYKYNLLSQEDFDKSMRKENKSDLYADGMMDVLAPQFRNDYINMDLKITNADLKEDSELGEILRAYENVRTHLKEEMNHIKEGRMSYLKLYQIKNNLGSMMGDMLDAKTSYKGITRPSGCCGGHKELDLFAIDYTNPAHIKACLSFCQLDGEIQPDSAMSHIGWDMKVALDGIKKGTGLDEIDLEIVECLNAGYSERAIGRELNRDKKAISQRIDKICKRIAGYYSYVKIES